MFPTRWAKLHVPSARTVGTVFGRADDSGPVATLRLVAGTIPALSASLDAARLEADVGPFVLWVRGSTAYSRPHSRVSVFQANDQRNTFLGENVSKNCWTRPRHLLPRDIASEDLAVRGALTTL